MEKKLLNSPQQPNETDTEIAEMFLNHSLLAFKRERILQEIDQTLQEGNKEQFIHLTEELKKIS
jgi:uncharacterized protein YpiB (UPF0302 family)